MEWTGCEVVVQVPGRVSGVPVLRGSRVQADAVLENYEAGESSEAIADMFDLKLGDVRAVLAFAASRQLAKPAL